MQKSEIAITSTLITKKEEWVATTKKQNTLEPEPNKDDIKIEIKIWISTLYFNLVRENSLIITKLGLLNLNFTNACSTDHSGRIKQYIRCLAIIF